MRNLRLGFALTGFSVFSILVLRFVPGPWIDDEKFMNSTIGYVVMGLIFYVAVYFLGLQSLEFFRLPRLHAKTFIALGVTIPYLFLNMYGPTEKPISLSIAVPGIIFLLSIGFGEEMFSRAFVFGIMQKFGTVQAVLVSSLFFGLLHLNLFVGSDWDSWAA